MQNINLQLLENLYYQCSKLSTEQIEAFISSKVNDDEKLEQTLRSLLLEQSLADKYFYNLQQRIIKTMQRKGKIELASGTIIDKYEIVSMIGMGRRGTVYKAKKLTQYDTTVAIKCFSSCLSNNEIVYQFLKEQQQLKSLMSDEIAQFIDGGISSNGIPYYIFEYVEGVPINKYIHSHQFSQTQILNMFKNVCKAVEWLHNNFILHQNIHVNNVFVTNSGVIKLLDSGISWPSLDSFSHKSVRINEYASPEQLQEGNITVASDIYQLGILLHQLLTGELPFAGNNVIDDLKRSEKINQNLPHSLQDIIAKCLVTNPAGRYLTVNELLKDFSSSKYSCLPIKKLRSSLERVFSRYMII